MRCDQNIHADDQPVRRRHLPPAWLVLLACVASCSNNRDQDARLTRECEAEPNVLVSDTLAPALREVLRRAAADDSAAVARLVTSSDVTTRLRSLARREPALVAEAINHLDELCPVLVWRDTVETELYLPYRAGRRRRNTSLEHVQLQFVREGEQWHLNKLFFWSRF